MLNEIANIDKTADRTAYDNEVTRQWLAQNGTQPVVYERKVSIEQAMLEDDAIIPKTLNEYVTAFKVKLVKTARSTVEMCRVVYEAKRSLDTWKFKDFCKSIGFPESSSALRKYLAIGKVYPRLIDYAEQLPASWTSIYLITQLPADTFEQMVKEGRSLSSIKGKELKDLLRSTQSIESLAETLPQENGFPNNYVFGRLMFTKKPDDTDWRAMRKALAELEARLPIRFVVNAEAELMWEERKLIRYENNKTQYQAIEFKPELWDLGRDANAVNAKHDVENAKTIEQIAA